MSITENEKLNEALEDFEALCNGKTLCITGEALNMVISAVKKSQEFEAIGTIEEFKALKEKLEKIKFIINEKHYSDAEECDYGNYYTCKNALMIEDIEEILET